MSVMQGVVLRGTVIKSLGSDGEPANVFFEDKHKEENEVAFRPEPGQNHSGMFGTLGVEVKL